MEKILNINNILHRTQIWQKKKRWRKVNLSENSIFLQSLGKTEDTQVPQTKPRKRISVSPARRESITNDSAPFLSQPWPQKEKINLSRS